MAHTMINIALLGLSFASLVCLAAADKTPCQKAEAKAKAGCAPGMVGCSSVSCNPDGSYVKEQSYGSTGHRWCVDANGKELKGTRAGPNEDFKSCYNCFTRDMESNWPADKKARCCQTHGKACDGNGPKPNSRCEQVGATWEARGKHCGKDVLTGKCDCAKEGWMCIAIDLAPCPKPAPNPCATKKCGDECNPGCPRGNDFCTAVMGKCDADGGKCLQGEPKCKTPCQKAEAKAKAGCAPGMVGCSSVGCNPDGSYVKEQGHGSTGHRWCVDANGKELKGTRAGPNEDFKSCYNCFTKDMESNWPADKKARCCQKHSKACDGNGPTATAKVTAKEVSAKDGNGDNADVVATTMPSGNATQPKVGATQSPATTTVDDSLSTAELKLAKQTAETKYAAAGCDKDATATEECKRLQAAVDAATAALAEADSEDSAANGLGSVSALAAVAAGVVAGVVF